MDTSLSMNTASRNLEDTVLKGARRARFSLHFNTRTMRRWLMVQWVTVPMAVEAQVATVPAHNDAQLEPRDLGRLLDRYQTETAMRRVY